MKQSITLALVVGAVALTVAGPAPAATQGRVAGTVTDSAGDPIPSATITVTSAELPTYLKELEVDSDGEFKILLLDATKTYLFEVAAPGYVGHKEEVKIAAGSMNNERDFALKSEEEAAADRRREIVEQPGYRELEAASKALDAGDVETARAQLEAAIAARDDLLVAWETLAEIEIDAGHTARALEVARGCLEIDDESVGCLAVAANAARELGDLAAAEEYETRYAEANPDDPAILFNAAVGHINALDDAAAKPLLEQCLEVDPDYPKCLYEYGMLLLRENDMPGAKEYFERYLEVAPDGEDAATVRETVKYL